MDNEQAICKQCGHPMPPGEEMFNYHGYSGPCPEPPIEKPENRGMKDGQSCFMIERRDHPELKPYAWLYYDYHSVEEWLWTQDPNKALHFADMASCDQIANEMPDDWDVRITDHSWMDHSNGRSREEPQ